MKIKIISITLFSFVLISCGKHYSMDDFIPVEKIDAHVHIFSDIGSSPGQARKDNFKLLTINTNTGSCEQVIRMHHKYRELKKKLPEEIEYTATFCLKGWGEPGWSANSRSWIEQSITDNAISVKVWKNIGMKFRDKNNNFVMVDDHGFDTIFSYLAKNKIPLTAHLGESKNCWLPLNEITTKYDSSFFALKPHLHMYKNDEVPGYEKQMAARDRMLDKNPGLIFIACHLANLEWNIDTLSQWLDKYPNTAVDLAGRMGHLFYHTKQNRNNVRSFFIQYQDRILYGTDFFDSGNDRETLQLKLHKTWLRDWEYLATANKMNSDLIDGEFRGLKLPKKVIDKIYSENAKHWYKGFKSE